MVFIEVYLRKNINISSICSKYSQTILSKIHLSTGGLGLIKLGSTPKFFKTTFIDKTFAYRDIDLLKRNKFYME